MRALATVAFVMLSAVASPATEEASQLNSKTLKGLELRSIGPALMSGRIADIAVHPHDQSTWYVAVGSGGVWKTANAGTTWTPVFDNESVYSIGCVAIDPAYPEVVWVGSGENVGGRHVGFGDGVYRSRNAGESWENLGLENSQHIGSIVIDPRDSDVVYVAAQGPLWSPGGDRGLYKTSDGGESWRKLLGGGDYTGVNEVVMDPENPDLIYAATHQRFRNVAALINGGPESGIWKSTDGGESWRELKTGLPEEDMGKIGLAISPLDTDIVYATIELARRGGGFYRSADRGETWQMRSDTMSGATGPHYYQEIFASPHAFDRVYMMDYRLRVTDDGGTTFRPVNEKHKHGDNHALAFDPSDPDYLLSGSDGGVYESWDLGETWKFVANLPVTQFYKVAVDGSEPFYTVYGGTQDNFTQGGPSRTDTVNGIRNADWFITLTADGHQPAVDPSNPNIVYSEAQQGRPVRFDRATGEQVNIRPQPEPGDPPERFNWDTPILVSPHAANRIYYASQRLWRSDDRGDSWQAISGDLTRDRDRLKLPMMGRVWSWDAVWDLFAMSKFGTITSIAESPVEKDLLWAGTDDGLLQLSPDGGDSWREIDVSELPGVPAESFVNDVKADLYDADTVYVALDNHKAGDFAPYLFKSTDRGASWKSMAGDLPDRHLVWRIVQDHVKPELHFLGTEFGIFFTIDGGDHWVKLEGGVPTIPFRDLVIQRRENDLVGATFGRSFYVLDDYTPLRTVSEELLAQDATLFEVRDALWYIERQPLGMAGSAAQGDAYFTAPNPPFGAVFAYHLREPLQRRDEARRQREREIETEGGDTPRPDWNELAREAREEDPSVVLTVRDTDGDVVRRIRGPISAGIHRVAWDLRYPSSRPFTDGGDEDDDEDRRGYLAPPGDYTVSLATRVEGELSELAGPEPFVVRAIGEATLPGGGPEAASAFLREVAALERAANGARQALEEAKTRTETLVRALYSSTADDDALEVEARRIRQRLFDLQEVLLGNAEQRSIGEARAPGILDRLRTAASGTNRSRYGPTPNISRSLELASEQFTAARDELYRLIDAELPALEERVEAAGVPWTPGRAVPEAP